MNGVRYSLEHALQTASSCADVRYTNPPNMTPLRPKRESLRPAEDTQQLPPELVQ